MRSARIVLWLLMLVPVGGRADELVIPGRDGQRLGRVPLESALLDRVDAALSPGGSAAAISVRHGRRGGASLYLLEAGRAPQVWLNTGEEDVLSDPVWSPDGARLAVVVRGPARRLAGTLGLKQGGAAWICGRGAGCREVGGADDLWRPVAFGGEDWLLAARVRPGDLVRLDPVRLGLDGGAVESLGDLPPGLRLTAPEPWPAPAPVPPQPPPDQVLVMPYIHQVYDTPNEFNGHWACGPTSTLMAVQHYGRLEAWPVTVDIPSPHNSDFGAYVSRVYTAYGSTFDRYQDDASGDPAAGAYGWCTDGGAAWAWRMQDYAQRHELSSDFDGSSTFAEVQAALDEGKVVVLSTGLTAAGHIITVKGYTGDGRLITNDPYGDKNAGYMNYQGEGAAYTWAEVDSAWFITVYGSGPVENDGGGDGDACTQDGGSSDEDGGVDDGGDGGGEAGDGALDDGEEADATDGADALGADEAGDIKGGCGCSNSGSFGSPILLGMILVGLVRRRMARDSGSVNRPEIGPLPCADLTWWRGK